MDMFRDTLQLPVETPENPFVAPANIQTIEAFMNRVSYQGVVDKWDFMNNVFHKKEAIQYPRFIKLGVADLMNKFPNIPKRLEEDYHSIKDDVPLVSVYTTRNVLVRGMLIPDAFLTVEIRETDDFKECETAFMKVDVPMNQPQQVVSTQGTYRITPSAHRSPIISVSPLVSKKRKKITGESSSPHQSLKITIKSTSQDMQASRLYDSRHGKIDDILHEVVPQIAENVTNDLIETNLKPCIVNTIIEDRDAFHSEVHAFISKEFKAHAPAIIEEIFKNHVQSNALRCKFEKSSTSNTSCREDDFHSYHDEHQNDDAPPEGENRVKRSKMSKRSKYARDSSSKHSRKDSTTYVSKQQSQHQEWDAWEEENVVDEDEMISENVTPEMIAEFQNVNKRVPTIFDHARMEATLRHSLSNLSRNAEEYAYHLEQ
ncbi:hypothetical protein Tco_1523948 [Tanacetum coccineum]